VTPQISSSLEAAPAAVSGPALRITGLSKTFPGTKALIDASIEIAPGEVHALIGQNGSGKSTLIKTLAGYHHADPGAHAELGGEPFAIGHDVPHSLRFVHQDLGSCTSSTRWTTSLCAGASSAAPAGVSAGASRRRRPTGCSSDSTSSWISTVR